MCPNSRTRPCTGRTSSLQPALHPRARQSLQAPQHNTAVVSNALTTPLFDRGYDGLGVDNDYPSVLAPSAEDPETISTTRARTLSSRLLGGHSNFLKIGRPMVRCKQSRVGCSGTRAAVRCISGDRNRRDFVTPQARPGRRFFVEPVSPVGTLVLQALEGA